MGIHVISDAVTIHIQRLIATIRTPPSLLVAIGGHAETHPRLDLQVHDSLVSLVELVSQVLPYQLLAFLPDIIYLFLFQDALKDAIARDLVHVKDFVGYNSIHAFRGQVIQHAPV